MAALTRDWTTRQNADLIRKLQEHGEELRNKHIDDSNASWALVDTDADRSTAPPHDDEAEMDDGPHLAQFGLGQCSRASIGAGTLRWLVLMR